MSDPVVQLGDESSDDDEETAQQRKELRTARIWRV